MATSTALQTMVQPQHAKQPSSSSRNNNIIKRPPPPPPITPPQSQSHSLTTTSSGTITNNTNKRQRKLNNNNKVFSLPEPLRDVRVFEKRGQVGQGTYGSVFMGADLKTGNVVALKRINTEQEENGFPITAIREVKILKALNHKNVVSLKEIVTSKDSGEIPKNVFMVFEYLEYDLTGILETPEIKLTQHHIKSWSYQLLTGVHYMHTNKIIHRDLKASNLLVNRKGELKIADWGLARSWNTDMKKLTKKVITLWYRPPELLLGCDKYTDKIDMWSVGCIIAEMFRRSGFLRGRDETCQLDMIFKVCGHPPPEDLDYVHQKWPNWKNIVPENKQMFFPRIIQQELKMHLPISQAAWMTPKAIDLIDKLMILNPDKRLDAYHALEADYFFENPFVKTDPSELNMNFAVTSVHEWEARKKHERIMAMRAQAAKQQP